MISDVLFDAERELRWYLDDPGWAHVYGPETRERVKRLIVEMRNIRFLPGLDTSPNAPTPPIETEYKALTPDEFKECFAKELAACDAELAGM
jgi:hypothetical protein